MGGVVLLGLLFATIFYLVLRLLRKPRLQSGHDRNDVVLRLDERRSLRNEGRGEAEDKTKSD